MSERTDRAEQILQIELNPGYAQMLVEITNLYGDALMDIARQEISSQGSLAMKTIATDAFVAALAMTQAVKSKISEN